MTILQPILLQIILTTYHSLYQMKIQEPSCSCINKNRVKQAALSAINQIRGEYGNKIQTLTKLLVERQAKIVELYHLVNEKQARLMETTLQWEQKEKLLNEALTARGQQIVSLRQQKKKREQENKAILQILNKQLQSKEAQLIGLKKQLNFDAFSQTLSTISKRQRSAIKGYSFDLSEYFQNFPETTMKLMNSLPEERPTDEKELGDMQCMFISRDDLSVEKYGPINRTFLKRKLKQEQKRFRFVIIYKPEKE